MTALVREKIWNTEGDRRKPYEDKCGELGKSVNPKDCEVPPEEKRGERSMELILPPGLQNGPTLISDFWPWFSELWENKFVKLSIQPVIIDSSLGNDYAY